MSIQLKREWCEIMYGYFQKEYAKLEEKRKRLAEIEFSRERYEKFCEGIEKVVDQHLVGEYVLKFESRKQILGIRIQDGQSRSILFGFPLIKDLIKYLEANNYTGGIYGDTVTAWRTDD